LQSVFALVTRHLSLCLALFCFQRFRFQFSAFLPPSALDQVNDHDDDGNHDQEMDETAADVADEAEKPEHEQDNDYSPEHGVPFD
jgi:cation transport regulator ChaB